MAKYISRETQTDSQLSIKIITNTTIKIRPNIDHILEGVVFCLSGYEKEQRNNIRRSALLMGAQYRPNYTADVTHLM